MYRRNHIQIGKDKESHFASMMSLLFAVALAAAQRKSVDSLTLHVGNSCPEYVYFKRGAPDNPGEIQIMPPSYWDMIPLEGTDNAYKFSTGPRFKSFN